MLGSAYTKYLRIHPGYYPSIDPIKETFRAKSAHYPPPEMKFPLNKILKVIKLLYGIPESDLHWDLTYLYQHVGRLGMKRTTLDPCVLIRHDNGVLSDIVILQVDDSFAFGTKDFLKQEEESEKAVRGNPRKQLTAEPTTFNGICLSRQEYKCASILSNQTIFQNWNPLRFKINLRSKERWLRTYM